MPRGIIRSGILLGAVVGIGVGLWVNRAMWSRQHFVPVPPEHTVGDAVAVASVEFSEGALQDALVLRDWNAAERLLDLADSQPASVAAGAEMLAAARDYITRGKRRDREFVIESPVELQLAVWMPNGAYGIGRSRADRPFTIRRDRTAYPLMLVWPDPKRAEQVDEMLTQWRIFDIQGVELNGRSDADPTKLQHLAELPVRYVDGDGLEKLPPGLLSQFTSLEAIDLSGVPADAYTRLIGEARGLPQLRSLRCPSRSGDSAEEMDALISLAALEDLVIGSVGAKLRTDLDRLSQLTALRSLEVQSRSCTGAELAAWGHGCTTLETLRLSEVIGTSDEVSSGMHALAGLSSLRELRIALRDKDAVASIGLLAQITNLQLTVIADPDPAPAPDLRALEGLAEVTKLTLRLDRCRTTLSSEEADALARIPQLTDLVITGAVVNDDVLWRLAQSTSLQNIRVESASITDAGLDRLATASNGAKWSRLTLVRCDGVTGSSLPQLVKMPSLIDLRLDRCPLTEAAWLAVKDPGGAEHIAILGAPVFTVASVEHIASWTRRPRIDLDTTLLDEAAQKRLRDLSASAILGTVIATQEANDF
jgi:hypothetical protein